MFFRCLKLNERGRKVKAIRSATPNDLNLFEIKFEILASKTVNNVSLHLFNTEFFY